MTSREHKATSSSRHQLVSSPAEQGDEAGVVPHLPDVGHSEDAFANGTAEQCAFERRDRRRAIGRSLRVVGFSGAEPAAVEAEQIRIEDGDRLTARQRRLLAAIHDPESIRRVPGSIGLTAAVPALCSARSPPRQRELKWG